MNRAIFVSSKNQTDTADIKKQFNRPIDLKNLKWTLSLHNLNTYYSWWNVSSDLGNDTLTYYSPNTVGYVTLNLEDGCYSAQSLFQHIQDKLMETPDFTAPSTYPFSFAMDLSDGVVTVTIEADFTIDFSVSTGLADLLGFAHTELTDDAVAPQKANLRAGIDQILVHVDAISGNSVVDEEYSDVIFSFAPSGEPNEIIEVEPNNSLKVGVIRTDQLNSIRVTLTDQDNKRINLRGRPLNLTFSLEPVL